MANIVYGFGSSHGPLLSMPADKWDLRADADHENPELAYRDGTYTYEELYELRKSNYLEAQNMMEVRQERHDRNRKQLDALAAKLADFGIKSKDVRQGFEVKKGYQLEQFTDAFERYLSADTPVTSATPLQAGNHAGYSVAESATGTPPKTPNATRKATADAGCSVVADRAPPDGKKEEQATLFEGEI